MTCPLYPTAQADQGTSVPIFKLSHPATLKLNSFFKILQVVKTIKAIILKRSRMRPQRNVSHSISKEMQPGPEKTQRRPEFVDAKFGQTVYFHDFMEEF